MYRLLGSTLTGVARPTRQIAIRRSLRARPTLTSTSILPARFIRPITIQAPGPESQSDRRDPANYEVVDSTPNAEAGPSSAFASAFAASSGSSPPLATSGGLDPSSSTGIATSTNLPAPPESMSTFIPRHLQHPFDTHAFVSYLERNDTSRGQARALMEGVREMIVKRGTGTRDTMVGKEEMENAAYLFNAALSELRTELSVQARNDGLAIGAMTGAIRREVESLEQKIKEDIQTLKHDIEMDMNNRKAETRTEMKGFDIYIEEINNKFTISLGDLRTEIEAVKWEATRRAISFIIIIVIATIAIMTFFTGEAADANKAAKAKPATAPMRDMAVGTEDEFALEDVGTYTEQTLEKLLEDSGVEKIRRARPKELVRKEQEKKKVDVDRI
ncbi:hypothetical protein CI109_107080 [Kwoniella shandongensis]|uniref:Uncharacterized protein n=1 Tax=Kwoniella shandongensis TaxID=1734106 RepID=A0A5M6BW52_9TREE|nr:uncharacterized protein CI109_006488 [Kwoniella shandongensis]KAA5525219.1 hypothetical protein CI109_006488 [Kwoniella shandongensis]